MAAITFDTLKFANRLKAAGIPAPFAEAEAAALSEVLDINLGELATRTDLARMASRTDLEVLRAEMATKADLDILRKEMATKAELEVLRKEMATKADLALLRKDLEAMEYRLTIRLGVFIASAVAIGGALLKVL